jgi:hypothetical protein
MSLALALVMTVMDNVDDGVYNHDKDTDDGNAGDDGHADAASSTPPMRWAAWRVVYFYSADSPGAITRSDEIGLT